MRARNKLDTWLGHGWAIIQGMGAHLLEHPEEFSMLDLGQLDLVTRFLHRALYLARVDRAKRTSRPRLSTVVDFPSTKDPPDEDEPA